MAVETTGSPAARYSLALSGLALRVASLIGNGITAASKPLQYAGSCSVNGCALSRWTLGSRESDDTSIATFPSITIDAAGNRRATSSIRPTSTQSPAIRPK